MVVFLMTEIWKPVPGWEDSHEVSDHGRVRTIARKMTDTKGVVRRYPIRLPKGRIDATGYHRYKLCCDRRKEEYKTHQLVAWAFLGPQADGIHVCHNDGNPLNNHISNLRYGTSADNMADRRRHGNDPIGINNPRAILNEWQVRLVRRLKGRRGCTYAMTKHWGVGKTTLYQIQTGKNWSHV